MKTNEYDAIVIGSGISGGWAAKELTERGLKTLLLERGRNLEHIKDYTNATKDPWQMPHRGGATLADKISHPVLAGTGYISEANLDYWVDEKQAPYTQVKPYSWMRGYHLGGRSLMWGRQSYRLSDFDFEANLKEGVGTDWPVRYKEIAPWYDHVERFAGISGSIENMPQLPDGQYQPPMEMNFVEKDVAARIAKRYRGAPIASTATNAF
jgi:choline dehydrogenase-like flavoprotein